MLVKNFILIFWHFIIFYINGQDLAESTFLKIYLKLLNAGWSYLKFWICVAERQTLTEPGG